MVKDYFKTRGFIPGGIVRNTKEQAMDMQALPAFLRTLMVADGTVTKALEAYFWENVKVELRWQKPVVLDEDLPLIDAHAGTNILQRDVILKGADSNDIYCYASSYLKLESLREDLRPRLINGEIGIGELLREVGLETYREIMDFSREIYDASAPGSASPYHVETIDRIYVINVGGEAAIQITERFPYRLFQRKGPG